MKNIISLFTLLFAVLFLSSCYDRDVLDDKGLNYFMPAPENVHYIQENGNKIKLTWNIPNSIPEEFRRPVAVNIQIVENDIYRQKVVLLNEEKVWETEIDSSKKYRYIVKLVGTFQDEYMETGRSSSVTSKGVVVEIK